MAFQQPTGFPDLSKLKSVLLTSGIQNTNNALFQVIDQLIAYLRKTQLLNESNSSSSSGSGSSSSGGQIFNPNILLLGESGNNDSEISIADLIPGQIGPIGLRGNSGIQGLIGPPGIDGIDGDDSLYLLDNDKSIGDGYLSPNVPLLGKANIWLFKNTFTNDIVDFQFGQLKFPSIQNQSANPNTLDDYEEGTWTPIDVSGAALTFSFPGGAYVKIGKVVWFNFVLQFPVTASGAAAKIGGFPFTADTGIFSAGSAAFTNSGLNIIYYVRETSTQVELVLATGAAVTNVQCSNFIIEAAGTYRSNA